MYKRKIKINERQLSLITRLIKEDSINNRRIIEPIVKYLDTYYEPSKGTYKESGEYHDTPMILNKVDGELITPKNLLRHLKDKFELGGEFLGQIIRDWYDGKLDGNFMLTQTVGPTE